MGIDSFFLLYLPEPLETLIPQVGAWVSNPHFKQVETLP